MNWRDCEGLNDCGNSALVEPIDLTSPPLALCDYCRARLTGLPPAFMARRSNDNNPEHEDNILR